MAELVRAGRGTGAMTVAGRLQRASFGTDTRGVPEDSSNHCRDGQPLGGLSSIFPIPTTRLCESVSHL